MRNHIQLFINGKSIRVSGDDAAMTLAEFLRRKQRLTGTKIVCAEGDCGSCAVLVGRLINGAMKYVSLTSCIQLMFQLDGTHVITVEGLRDGESLNPIQQSMVKCQGSQCGFCTPGFVVSLYDLMHDGRAIDANSVRRGLVGNLCRCTGYDSIIQSALQADRTNLKSLDVLYPPANFVDSLSEAASQSVMIETSERKFFKPATLHEAVQYRSTNPDVTIISGATDLGVLANKGVKNICDAMSLAGLRELSEIRREGDVLHVGATASLSEFERATLEHIPELGKFMSWFGSPLIKNAGTLAGNIVTGSPIGDSLPALLALDAQIQTASALGTRSISMNEFYTGYRKSVLAPDEIVTAIVVPIPPRETIFKLYKVSRRLDLDISAISGAFIMQRSADQISDIRIFFGGVGPMVLRLSKTETMLRGKRLSLELFEEAAKIARDEVAPISDVRGSENYRRALSGNLILKFWHDAIDGNNDDAENNPSPSSAIYQPALNRSKDGDA